MRHRLRRLSGPFSFFRGRRRRHCRGSVVLVVIAVVLDFLLLRSARFVMLSFPSFSCLPVSFGSSCRPCRLCHVRCLPSLPRGPETYLVSSQAAAAEDHDAMYAAQQAKRKEGECGGKPPTFLSCFVGR